jgi:hypothetical protein
MQNAKFKMQNAKCKVLVLVTSRRVFPIFDYNNVLFNNSFVSCEKLKNDSKTSFPVFTSIAIRLMKKLGYPCDTPNS